VTYTLAYYGTKKNYSRKDFTVQVLDIDPARFKTLLNLGQVQLTQQQLLNSGRFRANPLNIFTAAAEIDVQ
jgi:hypothetical protein